jgi:hypothetical protein
MNPKFPDWTLMIAGSGGAAYVLNSFFGQAVTDKIFVPLVVPAREMHGHGWNGLLVFPANAEAIEEAVLRLCRFTEPRRQLGSVARESMRHYKWQDSPQRT